MTTIWNKYWLSGFFCILLGTAANVIALGFGNLLLLASSSALTMIFNTVLSVHILQENFTRWDVLAITLICIGCICCMFYIKSSDTQLSEAELFDLYISPGSILYLGLSIMYLVSSSIVDNQIRTKVKECWEHVERKFQETTG